MIFVLGYNIGYRLKINILELFVLVLMVRFIICYLYEFLYFNFLICKIGEGVVFNSRLLRRIKELVYVKYCV